ncbi:hypothetical protein DL96DRAFT_1717422 [Flagelloscypha sp. PMI_526]|nr:hypothetical protein DL96DRAFT_1717422 [Flagelloscypha sp. PMI_526]
MSKLPVLPVELYAYIFTLYAWSEYGNYSCLARMAKISKVLYERYTPPSPILLVFLLNEHFSIIPTLYYAITLNVKTYRTLMLLASTNNGLLHHCRVLRIDLFVCSGIRSDAIWHMFLPSLPQLQYLTTRFHSAKEMPDSSQYEALSAILSAPIHYLELDCHFNAAQMLTSGHTTSRTITHLSVFNPPQTESLHTFQISLRISAAFPALTHVQITSPIRASITSDIHAGSHQDGLFQHILTNAPLLRILLISQYNQRRDMDRVQSMLTRLVREDPRVVIAAYPRDWGKKGEREQHFFAVGLGREDSLWPRAERELAAWKKRESCVFYV